MGFLGFEFGIFGGFWNLNWSFWGLLRIFEFRAKLGDFSNFLLNWWIFEFRVIFRDFKI